MLSWNSSENTLPVVSLPKLKDMQNMHTRTRNACHRSRCTLLIPPIKLLPGLPLPGTQLWKLLAFVTCKVEGMRADTTNKHRGAPTHGQAHACIQILSPPRSLSGADIDLPDMKIWRKAAISFVKSNPLARRFHFFTSDLRICPSKGEPLI